MADKWEYLMVNMTRGTVAKDAFGWLIEELYTNGAGSGRYSGAPATLSMLGEQGWELVASGNDDSGSGTGAGFLIFKRRKE